jgi:diacylglycerol kinase (ATP)
MKRESRPSLSWAMKFGVAFRGIYLALRHERSCWVHLFVTICIVVAGVAFRISLSEWSLLALCAALVWTAELLNTAIERLCEIVQPKEDARVAALLDVSAGGVLISAIGSASVGAVVFLPRIFALFSVS